MLLINVKLINFEENLQLGLRSNILDDGPMDKAYLQEHDILSTY